MQHGSSIVELDDKSLLVSWYSGSAEAARDCQIVVRRKLAGASNWQNTHVAVTSHERASGSWLRNKSVGNTVLFQDENKSVWLFYGAVTFGGWSGAHVEYKTSSDRGETWSVARRLTFSTGDLPRSKPIQLNRDELLLPLSHSAIRKYSYVALLKTQQQAIMNASYFSLPSSSFSHPSLVWRENEHQVQTFLRARGAGRLQEAIFDLKNHSWSRPEMTNLDNPDSPVDAIRLTNRDILIVGNFTRSGRTPLSIARTTDGQWFTKLRDIEDDPQREVTYPCFIQSSNGTFYVSYTWNYRSAIKCAHFDARWLGLDADALGNQH